MISTVERMGARQAEIGVELAALRRQIEDLDEEIESMTADRDTFVAAADHEEWQTIDDAIDQLKADRSDIADQIADLQAESRSITERTLQMLSEWNQAVTE